MKLKSLLLGSAAALALSTGAQAADPVETFVSLDVCDAYGISGLTIASDDTCLKISGEVEYDYWYQGTSTDDEGESTTRDSEIDWHLMFEATTQTDHGKAVAAVKLGQEDGVGNDDVDFEAAYVSFGDSTVLTAGYTGSLFGLANDQHILDDTSLTGDPGDSHVIQVVSDLGNGWSVGGGLEALSDNGATTDWDTGGRAGVVVGYDNGGVAANVGAYVYDLYNVIDVSADAQFDVYADVAASFGMVDVYADVTVNQDTDISGLLSAQTSLDIATIRAAVGAMYDNGADTTSFRAGAGVMFALTDTIDLDVAVIYNDKNPKLDDYFKNYPLASNDDVVHGILTLSSDFTDTLSGEAWGTVAYNTDTEVSGYGGGLGVTYEPGGNTTFDGGVAAFYDGTDEVTDYAVHFGAKKSF